MIRRSSLASIASAFALGLGLIAAMPATTARADSFSFGYSSGPWHSRPYYRDNYYYGPPHYRRSRVVVVPPPAYYSAPPRAYYAPPAYYVAPPPVVYAPAPYGGPQIAANPASPVFRGPDGQYCREYQATVVVGGVPQASYGTACLMPDGVWRVVN